MHILNYSFLPNGQHHYVYHFMEGRSWTTVQYLLEAVEYGSNFETSISERSHEAD